MVEKLELPRCSFCGKSKAEVRVLVSSAVDTTKFICDGCVAQAKKQMGDIVPDLIG